VILRKSSDDPGQGPPGFADFATARYPALVRLGALLSGDVHHGEDLAQMALLAVLRAWPRLHPDGDPEAYARVVMTRLASKASRRRWRGEKPTASMPELPTASRDSDAVIDAQRMLAELPTHQRVVLVLRYWLDLSEQDTAEALDCSLGTVKSRTSRALATLRAQATEDPPDAQATANARPTTSTTPTSLRHSTTPRPQNGAPR
jgi:RNA polymerase sigma-70 factor (sigma-E family)